MSFSVSHFKFRIIFFIVTMIFLWQALKLLPLLQTVQNITKEPEKSLTGLVTPVLVTVFYEALCPDSKSFITKQVLPTFEKAPKLISLSFVPYGKAKTSEDWSGNYTFSCQHGPLECEANKIHACAIAQISDMELLLRYISCMIANNVNPEYVCEKCGKLFSIDWKSILGCSKSRMGNELLKNYGDMTNNLTPSVTFIPTVLLNHQRKKQSAILKNLLREVCVMYEEPPQECSGDFRISMYR